MNFNSLDFLIFFPIAAILNFVTPRKYRLIPLLAASYYFYMSWNPQLVFLILFTTAVSYFSGILTEKKPKLKRLWLAVSIVASLSVLVFFKYYNFLAGGVSSLFSLFGAEKSFAIEGLILPVGISFYTFQTLSYSIDVYRGSIPAERNFLYYALFVSFFPQLVAGPIERPENLIPQLKQEHKFNKEDFFAGAEKMLIGYFKKVVVADIAAVYVNRVFNAPEQASGAAVIICSALFAMQIYCDFSGYTDIAIGCARIMGYRLMQNFDRPYSAENIKDFWARWHISLTSWFRDYLYIPLGGNRKGKTRRYINLLIVFLVSGLWHGADMTFVFWGLLHGIYQIVGSLTQKSRDAAYARAGLDVKSLPVRLFRRAVTFLLVCFAWIFFRANNTGDLMILLSKIFTDFGGASVFSEIGMNFITAAVLVLSFIILAVLDKRNLMPAGDAGYSSARAATAAVYIVWAVLFAWLILLAGDGTSSFVYFQF